jgi:hypothetical protein
MRLSIQRRALAAIGLVLVALPASALAQTPHNPGAEVVKILAELGTGGKAYAAAVQEALALEMFAMDGAQHALLLAKNGGPPADASDWVTTWRAQLADKVTQLKTDQANLHYPIGAVDELVRLDPSFAERATSLRLVPAATSHDIDNVLNLVSAIDADIAAATQRDPQAVSKLALDVVDGVRVQLEGEIAMGAVAEGAVGPKHPQYALAESMTASNRAMIEVYVGLAAQLRHQAVDKTALAKRVGDLCGEAHADAEQIAVLADQTRSKLDAKGQLPPAVQARFYKGWDTYADSSRNEAAIADECTKISVALSQGATYSAAIQTATQLKPLVDQRIAIDAERRADLSGVQ